MDGNNKFNNYSKVTLGVKAEPYQQELLLRKTPRVTEFRYFAINPEPMVRDDYVQKASNGSLSKDTDLSSLTQWAFYMATENGKGLLYHQNQPSAGIIHKGHKKQVLNEFIEEHRGRLYNPGFYNRVLNKKSVNGHARQLQRHLNKLYEYLYLARPLRSKISDKILQQEDVLKVYDLLPDLPLPDGSLVRPIQLCYNHEINHCPILIEDFSTASDLLKIYSRELNAIIKAEQSTPERKNEANSILQDLTPTNWNSMPPLEREIHAREKFWKISRQALEPVDTENFPPLDDRMKSWFEVFCYTDFGFRFVKDLFEFVSDSMMSHKGSYGIFQGMGLPAYQNSSYSGSFDPRKQRVMNLDGSATEEVDFMSEYSARKNQLYRSVDGTFAGANSVRFKDPFPMEYPSSGQLMFPLAVLYHEMTHTKVGLPFHGEGRVPLSTEVKIMDEYENRVRIMYGYRPRLLYVLDENNTRCSRYYADKSVSATQQNKGSCHHPDGWLY